LQVDALRLFGRELAYVGRLADGDDLAVADGDGLGLGLFGVHRPDLAVDQDQVGGGAGGGGETEAQQGRGEAHDGTPETTTGTRPARLVCCTRRAAGYPAV